MPYKDSDYQKDYYIKNRERILFQKKEYQFNNKEELKKYKRKYYIDNKETILLQRKENRIKNREIISLQKKKYYINNKEKYDIYRANNRNKIIERVQKRADIVNPYRNKPCEICNKLFPLFCMEFHHKDPKNKLNNITTMIQQPKKYTIEIVINEVKKCMIICANCHIIIQSNGYKSYPKWFLEYRSKLRCEKCGINKALEFHHKEKSSKIDSIVRMIHRPKKYSKEDVSKEIKKCQVLCRCCHRITEYDENKKLGKNMLYFT